MYIDTLLSTPIWASSLAGLRAVESPGQEPASLPSCVPPSISFRYCLKSCPFHEAHRVGIIWGLASLQGRKAGPCRQGRWEGGAQVFELKSRSLDLWRSWLLVWGLFTNSSR